MKEELECEQTIIHEDVINKVAKKMKDEEELVDLAEFFKIFADSTRIRIINALIHSDMCVCDIANALSMTKSAVSHQLATLRRSGIVKCYKKGKEVYYTLDDDHVNKVFEIALEHIEHKG